ncbi:pre-mRNA-splicing factor syf1 [Tulasnella sp. 417]|nr:pre-mRNA-splicing factor syf1 [Tulasnella sp. 417]
MEGKVPVVRTRVVAVKHKPVLVNVQPQETTRSWHGEIVTPPSLRQFAARQPPDCARAIYAHASQFCDPRVDTKFWQEWNSLEMEHGSEDTFPEMHSVQAQYNTAASCLAAQGLGSRQGGAHEIEPEHKGASDPMAEMEREALGPKGPSFAPSKDRTTSQQASETPQSNADEILIDNEDL